MSVAVRIGLTPGSKRVIRAWAGSAAQAPRKLAAALTEVLVANENHIKANKLSGTFSKGGTRGGRTPVALRSGQLRQSISHGKESPLVGFVGATKGPATAYARTILSDEDTTIRPKGDGYLWIPLPDNQSPSGQTRLSPRAAFDIKTPTGGRALSIFESKQGNLVAFLRTGGSFKRKTKGGRAKGDLKGKLLFVLKKEVTIKGTNALAEGVAEMRDRSRRIFNKTLAKIMPGPGNSAGGSG